MFLFAAFLLAPDLTFLFALLFFVILVLDTMITLLYLKIFISVFKPTQSRTKFLPRLGQVVKIIIFNYLIILSPKALSSCNIEKINSQFINIAIGEYQKVPTFNLKNYAVSNKELITVKHFKSKNSLMIRAKHQGFSTISTWDNSNIEMKYNIFIHTKKLISKIRMKLIQFEELGLVTNVINTKIILCGEIQTITSAKRLVKVLNNNDQSIQIESLVSLSKDLQKEMANLIYGKFIQKKITDVTCNFTQLPIKCRIAKSKHDINSIADFWFQDIPIEFTRTDEKLLLPNYKIKTKIILLESADSEVLALGLNKISNNLYSLLRKDLNSFVGENIINLENKKVKLSSIATPELLTRVGTKGEISIGSEIPFTKRSKEEYVTNWKFAGLKLKILLEKENDQFFLNIETELSRPLSSGGGSTISSNRSTSRIKVELDQSLKVLDIGHQGIQKEGSSIPYVSKIPILGRLFSSSSEIETYKNIKLLIQVERHP